KTTPTTEALKKIPDLFTQRTVRKAFPFDSHRGREGSCWPARVPDTLDVGGSPRSIRRDSHRTRPGCALGTIGHQTTQVDDLGVAASQHGWRAGVHHAVRWNWQQADRGFRWARSLAEA